MAAGIFGFLFPPPRYCLIVGWLAEMCYRVIIIVTIPLPTRFVSALKLCPNNRWGGEGLLGVSIRFCSFEGAEECVWHVLVSGAVWVWHVIICVIAVSVFLTSFCAYKAFICVESSSTLIQIMMLECWSKRCSSELLQDLDLKLNTLLHICLLS